MSELSGQMLHFAYGEDLAQAEFKRVCPAAEWFGPARLEGHQLVADVGGRLNVRPAAGSTVWGALWLVPAVSLAAFDKAAAPGFARTTRRIVSPAGPRTAATIYVSRSRAKSAPSPVAMKRLLEAAKANRLPAAYREELKSKWAR